MGDVIDYPETILTYPKLSLPIHQRGLSRNIVDCLSDNEIEIEIE